MKFMIFYEFFSQEFKNRLYYLFDSDDVQTLFDSQKKKAKLAEILKLANVREKNPFLWNSLIFYSGINYFATHEKFLRFHILNSIQYLADHFAMDMSCYFNKYFLTENSNNFIRWLDEVDAFSDIVELKYSFVHAELNALENL